MIQEKITGQDVTEEFIDLEARIKTQKALELQFLEIMKQAHKVEDALEVQRQIAEVRTEIEKLEGRKRFLENRASLSTITVSLQSPTAIVVNTSGFGRNMREAVADSVERRQRDSVVSHPFRDRDDSDFHFGSSSRVVYRALCVTSNPENALCSRVTLGIRFIIR